MSSNRRLVIVLCIVVLGACVAEITPTTLPSPTLFLQSSPTFFVQTLQRPPTITLSPTIIVSPTITLSPTIALGPMITPDNSQFIIPNTGVESTSEASSDFIIPVTGLTPTESEEFDKFQNFKIPSGALIPVTGFPPGVITRIKPNTPSLNNLTSLMLDIPALDVSIPILGIDLVDDTWDVSWLWDQAGWLAGTAYPTSNGNSVLTAHVVTADGKNGPFAHLKALAVDDYVFIYNSGYRYIYEVESNNFVKPNDISVFSHEDDSWLTLITCNSYDEKTGTYLFRVVVRARFIEVQEAH